MPRFQVFNNSFQYGELSPNFLARTDTEQYQKGAQKIENMIPLASGGLARRPGTVYIERSGFYYSQRVIPFIFSKDESYLLWIVATTSNVLVSAFRPDGLQSASPVNDTRYISDPYLPRGYVAGFSYPENSVDLRTFLDEMHYVQTGDVLIMAFKDMPPKILQRTGENTFSFALWGTIDPLDINLTKKLAAAVPYRDTNITGVTINPSATTGSGIELVASDDIFHPGMVDSSGYMPTYFKLSNSGTTGIVKVVQYNSPTSVLADVIVNMAIEDPTDNWAESAWSYYRGFPSSVGLFEGRLVMGGNDAQPDTVWASRVGNLFFFMQERLDQDSSTDSSGMGYFGSTTLETDPFTFTPVSKEVNRITWIQSGRTMAIGTLGQEFVASSGSQQRVLSAESVAFTDQTTVGSNHTQAIRVNKATVFVSRDGKRLYSYIYEFESDAYIPTNLNSLADHIYIQTKLDALEDQDISERNISLSEIGFKQLAWQNSRSILWALTDTGQLAGLTWDPTIKALAWFRYIPGGFYAPGGDRLGAGDAHLDTIPEIQSIAVVPSENGEQDNLYLLVKRTHESTAGPYYYDTFYLEVMGPDYKHNKLLNGVKNFSDGEVPVYADMCISSYQETATDTHTGFSSFGTETVEILADGFYHPPVRVNESGEIVLNRTANFVIAGLKYIPRVKLMPLDVPVPGGNSAYGNTIRVDRATVRFYRTLRAIIKGPNDEEIVGFRDGDVGMGEQIPFFTGDKTVNIPAGPDKRSEIEIYSDQPMPLNILGVSLRGQMNE